MKGFEMKIFVICPVRNAAEEITDRIRTRVAELEAEGHDVHWPPRDTPQDDPEGFDICTCNTQAIAESDVVLIYYDGESKGALFDLGASFVLGKRIVIGECPPFTPSKSLQNMIRARAKAMDYDLYDINEMWLIGER